MIEAQALLKKRLKHAGYSLTKPRRQVFTALHNHEAQSMRQIQEKIGKLVDRSSVYRTVALYEKLGIVQRLQIGWKYKLELSHAFNSHHHHLICTNCGAIFTFEESLELEEEIERTAHKRGFKVTEHQLEIRGVCEECQINIALEPIKS